MEIIEIGNTCVCVKVRGRVPRGKGEVFAVAEEVFSHLHRPLFEKPEISVYSNGETTLVFISRRGRKASAKPILHTQHILN